MSNLRESKKQQIRAKILSVSKSCFLEEGYDATTVRKIAKKANIGVGTVFNYFPSKAYIFLAIMLDSMKENEQSKPVVLIDSETSPTTIVSNYLKEISNQFLVFPPKVLRDFVTAILSIYNNQDDLLKQIIKADFDIINDLSTIIASLKDKEMIANNKDPDTIAYLLFSSSIVDLCQIAFNENLDKDALYSAIQHRVNYLIES